MMTKNPRMFTIPSLVTIAMMVTIPCDGHHLTHCSLFGPVWSCLALFGPVWPYLALFGPVWPYLALFGHIWPRRINLYKRKGFEGTPKEDLWE